MNRLSLNCKPHLEMNPGGAIGITDRYHPEDYRDHHIAASGDGP